jgi:dihydroorotate dehydrogenase
MSIYTKVLKPLAFKRDPEEVHNKAIKLGNTLGKSFISRSLIKSIYSYSNKKLETTVAGIKFKNPVGLAAGFDKNGMLTDILPSIGFGFIEIGSITAKKCDGNPKPRLWRLPKDRSIAVYYGLCNDGVQTISKRLKNKKHKIPLAISIAKTNDPSIKGDDSVNDYNQGFTIMKDLADFIVINVSCPNTGDGCSFEDPKLLDKLLKRINNKDETIFLKVSSGLDKKYMDNIIKVTDKYKITGFIIGNLNKKRKNLKSDKREIEKTKGGFSGVPVQKQSNDLIKYTYKKTKGKYTIIGVGGIFSAEDAYDKIKNGASLVQLITGMIYERPGIIKKINKGLVRLLEKDGYNNISEAIGKN